MKFIPIIVQPGCNVCCTDVKSRIVHERDDLHGTLLSTIKECFVASHIILPAKAREYIFTGVGLSVCVSVCDHDN